MSDERMTSAQIVYKEHDTHSQLKELVREGGQCGVLLVLQQDTER